MKNELDPSKNVKHPSPETVENLVEDDQIYKKYDRLRGKSGFQYSIFGVLALVVYGFGMFLYLDRKERNLKSSFNFH